MARHQHHHHHHGSAANTTGAILLGAAAAAAAANHYSRQQREHQQQHQHAGGRRQQDVFLVQTPLPPHPAAQPGRAGEAPPQFLHVKRPHQRSMLVLNDGNFRRPPGWHLKGYCEICLTRFGVLTRRHHCRNCGRSVCWRHSAQKAPLPHYGFLAYVRTCDACYPVLIDCYRSGQPYHPDMLLAATGATAGGGAGGHANPYAGPDNLASYVRPAAPDADMYAPVSSHAPISGGGGGGGGGGYHHSQQQQPPRPPASSAPPAPMAAPPSQAVQLPQAELVYDGTMNIGFAGALSRGPSANLPEATALPVAASAAYQDHNNHRPPPSAPGGGGGGARPGEDLYRVTSGTAPGL